MASKGCDPAWHMTVTHLIQAHLNEVSRADMIDMDPIEWDIVVLEMARLMRLNPLAP